MSTKNSIKTNVNDVPEINGKKNIKKVHEELGFGEVPNTYSTGASILDIDQALQKELKDLDLVYRFINFKQYKQKGFHQSKWQPYKRTSSATGGAVYNTDPDGYTVKQDLVLAVKPRSWNEAHKKMLQAKADRLAGRDAEIAKEFRDSLREAGISSVVKEGYED